MGKTLELMIGILNGTIGDYLARKGNGLATPMELIRSGRPVTIDRASLARAYPSATGRVVVLVHGMMANETVWDRRGGEDYGTLLERDLAMTPLYVRYNSGRAIPENGADLARLLEALVDAYPVPLEQILLLGHSMGGLVVRSACHSAALDGQRWLALIRRAIYVGTPHRGAPLERWGRVVARLLEDLGDPYTRLIADIANLRSDGIKDLGDARLRAEDRARPAAGVDLDDARHPVPLLPGIRHYLVAGTISSDRWLTALFGDAIVPVLSATDGLARIPGSVALPPSHVTILPGVAHLTLAHHPVVYEHIRSWCEET